MTKAGSAAAGLLAGLSNDLAAAVEKGGQTVVAIHARRRIASSGVHWRPGVIVAANHTITRDEDIAVTLPDGSTSPGTLAGRDPSTDLAVLRLPEAPPVTPPSGAPTDAVALRVGQFVLALGRPGRSVTASLGVVSAVGGEWRTWQGGRIDQFVRLDLAIYDGFSGGPLIDPSGRVLGINSSGLARARAITIPASTVNRVADQLLASGRVARGYLGLAAQPVRLPEALQRSLQGQGDKAQGNKARGDYGLLVVNVAPGSPADQAGILLGDILIALNGVPMRDPADVFGTLSDRVGQPVEAQLVRGGTATTATITVGERPSAG